MSVTYVPYAGEMVSREWGIVLHAADAAGVRFHLNEGHRTFARQQFFYNGWIHRLPGFNLAAFPSHTAPHIRTGRIDHALDINQTDGGVYRLAAFLRKHGAHVVWEVPGESWHIWVPASDLAMLAKKLRKKADPLRGFHADEKRWIKEYVKLLDDKKNHHDSKDKRERRAVLRHYMTQRRQRIWRSAEGRYKDVKRGWNRENRKKRYNTLAHYT